MEQTSSKGSHVRRVAILLSSLLFAVVLLYGMTKHRWSWRRIVERTRQTFIALIVLTAAVIGGVYFWNQLPTPPSPQTEYAGLRLGIGPDEVISQRGYPPLVLGEMVNDRLQEVIETSNLEKGKRVQDYRDWVVYEDNLYRLDVTFDEKAALVAISCFSKARLGSCPSMLE